MRQPCRHCGSTEGPQLLEAWTDHRFMVEACCEAAQWEVERWCQDDPTSLLEACGAADLLPGFRRVAEDESGTGLLLDYGLTVRPVSLQDARAFVAAHHAHNAAPLGWRYGAALWNGPTLVGVVMVGRPVARMICQDSVVEVNRLCLRRDVDLALRLHGASLLYGWAAREAKRRGFSRIITYTLATEPGTSLIAAGWKTESRRAGGGSWDRPGRRRAETGPLGTKVRWSRQLRAQDAGPLFQPRAAPAALAA